MLGRNRLAVCMAAFWLSMPMMEAYASPKEDLAKTRNEMEQSRKRQEALEIRQRQLERELARLQKNLVELAAAIQKGEEALSESEAALQSLEDRLSAKEAELSERKQHLAGLVQAALRLSRMPPEAMVMMPGDTDQLIKASRALKMASHSIREETAQLGRELAEIERLKQQTVAAREELGRKQQSLMERRTAMQTQLEKRSQYQEALGKQKKEEATKLSALAKKANNLQSLVAALEKAEQERLEKEQRQQVELQTQGGVSGVKGKLRSFASARGRIRPPVNGRVVQSFGSARGGATTKGILIAARSNAQVTAPYDAEVIFAGTFLSYGRMVILRHSDQFYTLLAGLAKIDTGVGQFLLEGEPIGAMGEGDASHGNNRLYVELRKETRPIDPMPWMSGLNKKTQEN